MSTIKDFTDLIAWQKNHQVVLLVYKLTRNFPKDELFGLTSQIRRSASSITANIAEGFGRYHYRDKARFYHMARGSNTETQNHLILARDLKYLTDDQYEDLTSRLIEGHRLINGLIKGAIFLNVKG